MFEKIKEIIFKIKDYDRLQHDYSLCLCYFTNNRLSKTNYEIRALETLICDTIGEYQEEGYEQAKKQLALTAESIGCIIEIWLETLRDGKWREAEREDVCKEVLRKYNQTTK